MFALPSLTKLLCVGLLDTSIRVNGIDSQSRDTKSNHAKQAEPGNESLGSPGEEILIQQEFDSSPDERPENEHISCYPKEVDQAIRNAMFIAQHIDNADEFTSVRVQALMSRVH